MAERLNQQAKHWQIVLNTIDAYMEPERGSFCSATLDTLAQQSGLSINTFYDSLTVLIHYRIIKLYQVYSPPKTINHYVVNRRWIEVLNILSPADILLITDTIESKIDTKNSKLCKCRSYKNTEIDQIVTDVLAIVNSVVNSYASTSKSTKFRLKKLTFNHLSILSINIKLLYMFYINLNFILFHVNQKSTKTSIDESMGDSKYHRLITEIISITEKGIKRLGLTAEPVLLPPKGGEENSVLKIADNMYELRYVLRRQLTPDEEFRIYKESGQEISCAVQCLTQGLETQYNTHVKSMSEKTNKLRKFKIDDDHFTVAAQKLATIWYNQFVMKQRVSDGGTNFAHKVLLSKNPRLQGMFVKAVKLLEKLGISIQKESELTQYCTAIDKGTYNRAQIYYPTTLYDKHSAEKWKRFQQEFGSFVFTRKHRSSASVNQAELAADENTVLDWVSSPVVITLGDKSVCVVRVRAPYRIKPRDPVPIQIRQKIQDIEDIDDPFIRWSKKDQPWRYAESGKDYMFYSIGDLLQMFAEKKFTPDEYRRLIDERSRLSEAIERYLLDRRPIPPLAYSTPEGYMRYRIMLTMSIIAKIVVFHQEEIFEPDDILRMGIDDIFYSGCDPAYLMMNPITAPVMKDPTKYLPMVKRLETIRNIASLQDEYKSRIITNLKYPETSAWIQRQIKSEVRYCRYSWLLPSEYSTAYMRPETLAFL